MRPLGLWFWGKVWTLVAWCEMRSDFRAFRIDRIATVVVTGRTFKPERGKQLADFYRTMERSEDGRAPPATAPAELGPLFRRGSTGISADVRRTWERMSP